MAQGFRLPAYEFPQNALLNLKPLTDAVDGWQQQQQQRVENERQNALLDFRRQQMGMDQKRLDYDMGGRDFQREQQERQFAQSMQAQDRQFGQQRSLAEMQQRNAMAMQDRSFGQQRDMAGVQTDEQMRLARGQAVLARQEMLEKAKALGLAPPEPSAVAPPQPQATMPSDPYQRLTTPAIPPEQAEADRKKRAGQALLLNDPKAAARILNKEEDPKEYQTKDALFAERMGRSEIMLRGIIGTPEQPKYDPGSRLNNLWPDTGFVANMTNSQAFRGYQGSAREWIAALLRKDTGAAVTQTEWDFYWPTFFPQPGDSKEVQAQKLNRRVMAAQGLRGAAGPAFDRMYPGFDQEMRDVLGGQAVPGQPKAPQRAAPQVGAVEDGFRFRGGDPAKPDSWERVTQ